MVPPLQGPLEQPPNGRMANGSLNRRLGFDSRAGDEHGVVQDKGGELGP